MVAFNLRTYIFLNNIFRMLSYVVDVVSHENSSAATGTVRLHDPNVEPAVDFYFRPVFLHDSQRFNRLRVDDLKEKGGGFASGARFDRFAVYSPSAGHSNTPGVFHDRSLSCKTTGEKCSILPAKLSALRRDLNLRCP